MVQTLMATVRRSPLLRAGVVIAALSAVAVMASGALPISLQCLADSDLCNPADDAAVALVEQPEADTAPAPTFPPPSTSPRTAEATPPVKVARAAFTHDDLINATFAALSGAPRTVVSGSGSSTAPAADSGAESSAAQPTTRIVQTTAVSPPGPAPLTDAKPETIVAEASTETPPAAEVVEVSDRLGPPRIGAQAVNARSGPGSSNKKLFALAANAPVTVLDEQSKWLEIDDGKGHRGWVYSEYVVGDATPTPAASESQSSVSAYAEGHKSTKTATVLGSGVSVRSGAGGSYEKLFALAGGEEVDITEEKRGWLHIVDSKGRSGWAYSSFFKRGG